MNNVCWQIVRAAISLALIVPLTAYSAGQSLETRRAELNRLLADEWKYTLRTQPELATQVGDNRYNDRLADYSDKAIADDLAHSRHSLHRFEAIDVTGFPERERLNHALMMRSLRTEIETAQFKDWEMPATQIEGIHLKYASLVFDTPSKHAGAYEPMHSGHKHGGKALPQGTGPTAAR
jgi:uncharacterized protein (DUF885 family)